MNAEQTSGLDDDSAADQGRLQAQRRRVVRALLVVGTLGAVVFGCSSPKSDVYDATRSAASLQSATWKAASVEGMPNTLTGAHQEGYLETTAPDGTRIDIQFLQDRATATQELNAVVAQDATFVGVTIGNALIFAAKTTEPVPKIDLDALSALLRS